MLIEASDIELMLRAREGDRAAFQQLALRYRAPLQRFFASLLADRSQAEDCAQETLLRLWMLRASYQPSGRFSTYLFQIANNHVRNQRRKLQAEAHRTAEETQELRVAVDTQPENVLQKRERNERLQRAVSALPEHYRVVFCLSRMEGMKLAEIACQLQIPVGTVKSRLAEATRRLRITLTSEFEE